MAVFACESVVTAPVDLAWSVIADVMKWPEWLPTVSALDALDSPTLAIGARFRIVQPKLRPAIWRVTEVVPQERFSWESTNSGVSARASHAVAALEGGSCRLTLEMVFSGPLAILANLMAGSLTRQYLATECEAFRRRLDLLSRGTALDSGLPVEAPSLR